MSDDICPGLYACHSCMVWCRDCGDVSQICDDPQCDIHKREDEIQLEYNQALKEVDGLKWALQYAEKRLKEAKEHWNKLSTSSKRIDQFILGPRRCVVPRSFTDHKFARNRDCVSTPGILVCEKCGQTWASGEEDAKLKPCHDSIVAQVMEV